MINSRNKPRGWLLILIGIALPIVVIALSFLVDAYAGEGGKIIRAFTVTALVGGLYLINYGRRDITLRAQHVREKDTRAPIVYLRPFTEDGVEWNISINRSHRRFSFFKTWLPTYESRITHELKKIGPVIAVGDPLDERPQLGAARMYIDSEYWQSEVIELLSDAALVVLHAGESDGLVWEIEQVIKRISPEKIIFCLPLDKKCEGVDVERWQAFRKRTMNIFEKGLPEDICDGEFLYFDKNWTPEVLIPYRGHQAPAGMSLRDKALKKLFYSFYHVSTPYGLRLLFAIVMTMTCLFASFYFLVELFK